MFLDFNKQLKQLLNRHNIDVYLGVPDFLLTEFLCDTLVDLKEYLDKKNTTEQSEIINVTDFAYDSVIRLKSFNENFENYNAKKD